MPPAFYDRDGTFVSPPPFEMPAYVTKKPAFFTHVEEKVKDLDHEKQLK